MHQTRYSTVARLRASFAEWVPRWNAYVSIAPLTTRRNSEEKAAGGEVSTSTLLTSRRASPRVLAVTTTASVSDSSEERRCCLWLLQSIRPRNAACFRNISQCLARIKGAPASSKLKSSIKSGSSWRLILRFDLAKGSGRIPAHSASRVNAMRGIAEYAGGRPWRAVH